MMHGNILWCSNCVMPSTRPRVTFNDKGLCNACQWAESKKNVVDWDSRGKELEKLCDKFRSQINGFDCIVPCSGGKDGSTVNYKLKHEMGMTPLALTISIPLPFEVGDQNLKNFIASGYDHILITPNPEVTRAISKIEFLENGRPLFGWQISLQAAILRTAVNFRIPLIMYGEDGEVEYGGTSETNNKSNYSREYAERIYLSGIDPSTYLNRFTEKELALFCFPSEEEVKKSGTMAAHWSYFDNWDPYENYLLAKEKCGMQERDTASVGTYNNFAQTDTCLIDLHYYLMYLKFGFGRCSQDVGIDIRRGAMTRKQGMELVRIYDNQYPEPYIDQYLEYFDMTKDEFNATLDKLANKKLFQKIDGRWKAIFEII
jgi:N-acetyl sugar amidotransferase